jgi:agmatinase
MSLIQLSPPTVPFLSSRIQDPIGVVLAGLPLDLTESFRSGTADGPRSIREVSDVLESYSPNLDRDLEDVGLRDLGDLVLDNLELRQALRAIGTFVATMPASGLPIFLGGEHTVTLPLVRALAARHSGLRVLQVDAHADLIHEFRGRSVCHATVFRRIAELIGPKSLVQVGIRSGTREELLYARELLHSSSELYLPGSVREMLASGPVYVSIDIDVLDPSVAPGTGCPEPGGFGFADLMDFLYSLRGLPVVAVDLVEVAPRHDPSGVTSVVAAKIVREVALLFSRTESA